MLRHWFLGGAACAQGIAGGSHTAAAPHGPQVYTWVNLSSISYQQAWARLGLPTIAVPSTAHSFTELKYALRSLHKHGLWDRLNRIYIVIDRVHGPPSWLDLGHPKVVVVPHERIFSDKSALPTRNFNAIMANIHRIPNLANWFIVSTDNYVLARRFKLVEMYETQHKLIHTFLTDGIYPSSNSWQVSAARRAHVPCVPHPTLTTGPVHRAPSTTRNRSCATCSATSCSRRTRASGRCWCPSACCSSCTRCARASST